MFPDYIPYSLIGKFAVGLVSVIVLVALFIALGVLLYAIWYRGLSRLSDKIWEPYDIQKGERPSKRMYKLSAVLMAFREFEVHKLPKEFRRIDEELSEDD